MSYLKLEAILSERMLPQSDSEHHVRIVLNELDLLMYFHLHGIFFFGFDYV